MTVEVSPICSKDGQKFAYVSFSDEGRSAEGMIPDCKIIRNNGFTDEEVSQLETYLLRDLSNLKQIAAGIDIFGAII